MGIAETAEAAEIAEKPDLEPGVSDVEIGAEVGTENAPAESQPGGSPEKHSGGRSDGTGNDFEFDEESPGKNTRKPLAEGENDVDGDENDDPDGNLDVAA